MENKKLSWRNITLNQYDESYFDFVYKCYQNYDSRFLFTNDFVILSKDEFWNYLHKRIDCDFHDFMIISDNNYSVPIGFIYTYNYDEQNDHIYFSIYLDEKSREGINIAITGFIFFDYLFKYYPLRKIYCSIFDYNTISKTVLKNAGFKLEGILKDYRYYNRKFHDMCIYSLFRKDFYALKEKLRS